MKNYAKGILGAVLLTPILLLAHGEFETKKTEYTSAVAAALDVYHGQVGEVFVQVDSWKNGNAINVQIYKTATESFVYECHLGPRIDCHRH